MKKRWSTDRIVTIAAITISLFTLIVFMRQTNIIERQSRLSAIPYLYVETAFNYDENHVTVTLNNYGVGPAIIENALIFYEGETYENGFAEFVKQDIFIKDSLNILSQSSTERGLALPPGAERIMIRIGGTRDQYHKAEAFLEKLDEIGFDYLISYKSIYDDRWKIHLSNPTPEEY